MNSNKLKLKFSDREKEKFDEIKPQLDFLRQIQIEMDDSGINRQELAKKLGVSRSFVSQLFTGTKKINLNLIKKLKDTLEIDITINVKKKPREKTGESKSKKINSGEIYKTFQNFY